MNIYPLDSSINGAKIPHPGMMSEEHDQHIGDEHDAPSSMMQNAVLELGWGRLLYAPSFESSKLLAQTLMQEAPGKRDIAMHVESPQLVLAEAPANLFLDPSLVFRRQLDPATKPT